MESLGPRHAFPAPTDHDLHAWSLRATRTAERLELLRQCPDLFAERRELRSDLGIPGLGCQLLEAFVRLAQKEQENAPQFVFRSGGRLAHGQYVPCRTKTVNGVMTD